VVILSSQLTKRDGDTQTQTHHAQFAVANPPYIDLHDVVGHDAISVSAAVLGVEVNSAPEEARCAFLATFAALRVRNWHKGDSILRCSDSVSFLRVCRAEA
jgi:hypothetical protein